MRAIRRINNNVAVCLDSDGTEMLAMGKGIGFGQIPRDIPLENVERTFYDVDGRYIAAINNLPAEVLDFAIACVDYIQRNLSYQLSPNLAFIIADHLAFAITRAQNNIHIQMPLSYDVRQTHPDEFRIATNVLRAARKQLNAHLADDEAAAIALNIVAAKQGPSSPSEQKIEDENERMLSDITDIVEKEFGIEVDRDSFAYSRYATHMRYLFNRMRGGQDLDAPGLDAYGDIEQRYPEGAACVEKIAKRLAEKWGGALSEDEKLYLIIHVSRICNKGSDG